MNDGVISGALQFIAVGAPSLITLWDKTAATSRSRACRR